MNDDAANELGAGAATGAVGAATAFGIPAALSHDADRAHGRASGAHDAYVSAVRGYDPDAVPWLHDLDRGFAQGDGIPELTPAWRKAENAAYDALRAERHAAKWAPAAQHAGAGLGIVGAGLAAKGLYDHFQKESHVNYTNTGAVAALRDLGLFKLANVYEEAWEAAGKHAPKGLPLKHYALAAGLPLGVGALGAGIGAMSAHGEREYLRSMGADEDKIEAETLTPGQSAAVNGTIFGAMAVPPGLEYLQTAKQQHARDLAKRPSHIDGFVDELRKRTKLKDRHLMAKMHPDVWARQGAHKIPQADVEAAYNLLNEYSRRAT